MPTFYECHVEASMKMMSKSLSVLSCNHRGAAAARGKTGSHDPTDRRIRGTLAIRWKTAEIKEKANLASCCSDWKQADKTWMQYNSILADLRNAKSSTLEKGNFNKASMCICMGKNFHDEDPFKKRKFCKSWGSMVFFKKIRWEVLSKKNNLLGNLCATRCWWRNEWKMLGSFTCVLLGQLASQPMNAISPKSLFPCVPHHKYTNMQQAIVGESQGRCNQKYFSCNTPFL